MNLQKTTTSAVEIIGQAIIAGCIIIGAFLPGNTVPDSQASFWTSIMLWTCIILIFPLLSYLSGYLVYASIKPFSIYIGWAFTTGCFCALMCFDVSAAQAYSVFFYIQRASIAFAIACTGGIFTEAGRLHKQKKDFAYYLPLIYWLITTALITAIGIKISNL